MVGTNNLPNSITFYDIVLKPLGLIRVDTQDDMVAYAPISSPAEIEFYVCKPFNQNPARFGNGAMIAFLAASKEMVEQFHQLGIKNGGLNEGNPGPRPTKNDPYYAYLRDLDGNKLCVYCVR